MTGLNLPNQTQPVSDIICAGQPQPGQFEEAASSGVKTVINLRREAETNPRSLREEVESAGMHYVNIPIGGPGDLNRDNAKALADAIEAAGTKVLIHCGSSNRVGALLALKAHWFDDMPADEAMKLGEKAGMTGLAPAVESILKS